MSTQISFLDLTGQLEIPPVIKSVRPSVYRSVSHSRLSVSQYRPVCWLVAQPVSQSVINALGHYISQSFILSSNKSDKQSISQAVPLTVSQPVNE